MSKVYLEEMPDRSLLRVVKTPKFDITYEIKREIIDDLTDGKNTAVLT